jgi:hypothetical protein
MYYSDEKKAFHGLRENKGMIRYLGNYSHSEREYVGNATEETTPKNTCNILLEYGIYDLRHIFAFRLPPVFPTEIAKFWEGLFGVAHALQGVHDLKIDGNEFHG